MATDSGKRYSVTDDTTDVNSSKVYDYYSTNGLGNASDYFDGDYGNNPYDTTHILVILLLLYSLVTLACVLGNVLVIVVIAKHRKMRNITNFFLANLAASDLCVGIFCVMPTILHHIYPYWFLGEVMCRLHYFVQSTSYTCSIIILVVISMERYFAIIHPMLCRRMSRMCLLRVVVIVVWLVAVCYGIPILITYGTVQTLDSSNNTLTFCLRVRYLNTEVIIFINFVLWYIIPLVLMAAMYVKISVVLWKSSSLLGGMAEGSAVYTRKTRRQGHGMGQSSEQSETEQTFINYTTRCSGAPVVVPPRKNPHVDPSLQTAAINDKDIPLEQNCAVGYHKCQRGFGKNDESFQDEISALQNGRKMRGNSPGGSENVEHFPETKGYKKFWKRKPKEKKVKPKNALIARRKVIRLLIAIIVAFALCVLPHHVRMVWQTMSKATSVTNTDLLAAPITDLILFFNSCLNPFLYAFLSDNFRMSLRELFCKRRLGRLEGEKNMPSGYSRSQATAF